jgi:hypothetical protein
LWVIGGFLPVIVPIPARVGFVVVAAAAGFAALAYWRASKSPSQVHASVSF